MNLNPEPSHATAAQTISPFQFCLFNSLSAFPPFRLPAFTPFLLLFLPFAFCLLPYSHAQYNDGDGSPESPYEIAEPNQLIYMSQHPEDWGLNFILSSDINMNLADPNTFTTAVIAPDTSSSDDFQGTPFTGVFKGNGHTISNLTIDTTGTGSDYLGMFGQIAGPNASVENLGLENIKVTGGDYSYFLGGLCGYNSEGTISNCFATVSVNGGDSSSALGGLCGRNENGNISDCYSTGPVTAGEHSRALGGLCGYNLGSISNCYATSSVSGEYFSAVLGGLCGFNSGSINFSSSSSTVTSGDSSDSLGGLCGNNYEGTITNCYTAGSVTGDHYLGGLCGQNRYGSISDCQANGSINGDHDLGGLCGYNYYGNIRKCYFTGSVIGQSSLGGLCGDNLGGSINNCYATGLVSGDGYLGGLCGIIYRGNITNCYAAGSVTGGDDSLYLGGLCGYNRDGSISNCYASGSVTGGNNSQHLGGLCGIVRFSGSISNCYFLDTAGPDNGLGEPLDDPNMRIQGSFVNWDFVGEEDNGTEDHWQLCIDGYVYPRLTWQFINPADFLHPGRTDLYDLFVLTHDWLKSDSRCCDIAPPPDGDDIVNLFDYIEFSRYWFNEISP